MIIEKYLDELAAQKLNPGTILNYQKVLTKLNNFKRIEKVTKDDLIAFLNKIEIADTTSNQYRALLKRFFTDIGKPEVTAWVKPVKLKETLHPEDILTADDVNAMISTTESHYWKAFIAFLFETGCRVSEARALKYKDCIETDQGMIVHIPTTKTAAGYRKTVLPFSAQYIRNLKTYTNAKNEDIIFHIKHTHTTRMLHEIAETVGITKPVSAHKFRHAQATEMVRRNYQEAIIRKKLGWSPTSTMIARYQHLVDDDVVAATLENTGKMPITAKVRTELVEAGKISITDVAGQYAQIVEENRELWVQVNMLKKAILTSRKERAIDENIEWDEPPLIDGA